MSDIHNDRRKDSDLSIALCTCEGSLFLSAQLKSLEKQTVLPAEVVICDDASTDNTVEIVERFAVGAPFKVRLYINEQRVGVIKNFNQALALCQGQYIALCDQDDLWDENRLEAVLSTLKAEGDQNSTPLLIHSDLSLIDSNGEVIAPSYMKLRKIRHLNNSVISRLLVQNFVTGNTVLINRKLKEAALPLADEALMHDWWLALVAAALGRVIYIDQPLVMYRQHGTNLVGATRFLSVKYLKHWFSDLNMMEKQLAARLRQAHALAVAIERDQADNKPEWLFDYLTNTRQGGLKALMAAIKHRVFMQGFIRNVYYLYVLLKGDYCKHIYLTGVYDKLRAGL